ncbi:MAG: hypothetical protein DHS20C14_20080 [Phycisphaeraceae bacterium]|nr:MAG: hypothetical protein DHS20C14_20080 [Phycisphaeraceae bacterium]
MQAGQPRRAADYARKALEKNPDHPRANMIMGVVLRDAGDLKQAIEHLEKAAAAEPTSPEFRFTLANTLHQDPRRTQDAKREYLAAVELAPESVAAHAALAKLYEELNELPEARAAAARALELSPDHPASVLVIGLVELREGDHAAARDTLAKLVEDDGDTLAAKLPRVTQATALNRYATALDRLGDYAKAAVYFERAQQARWSCGDAQRIKPDQPLQVMDASRAVLTAERVAGWRDAPPVDDLPDPAFLVGFPRSGTTLTEQMLSAHPGIATLDENSPLAEVLPKIAARAPAGTYPNALPHVDDAMAGELRAQFFESADKRLVAAGEDPRGDRVLIDKLPLTIMHAGVIARLFPRAKIIVAIRDPRDVCVSCFSQIMKPNNAMSHLVSIPSAAAFYDRVMSFWAEMRDRLGLDSIESKYEDLVADPEAGAKRLVAFLGLAWEPAVLNYRDTLAGKAISTPSYEAVSKPINTGSIGRWKNYADTLAPVMSHLDPYLDAYGYQR